MDTKSFNTDLIFDEKKVDVRLILESEFSKEVRIAMQKEQEMKAHQTKFPIIVHVLEGIVDFGVDGKTHRLEKGSILSLKGGILHSLLAKEKSVIRLSLSKPDKVSRAEAAAKV